MTTKKAVEIVEMLLDIKNRIKQNLKSPRTTGVQIQLDNLYSEI